MRASAKQTPLRGRAIAYADARISSPSDKLGRLTGRTEPDLTSTWVYDTQTEGIGNLASTSTTAGFQRTFS